MPVKLSNEEVNNRIHNNFIQNVRLVGDYVNKRTEITLYCDECGYEWKTKPQNVLYVDKKAANHLCPNCGKKQRIKVKCAYCGKIIERTPSQVAKNQSGYFYCCHEHGNLHKNQLRKEQGEWENSANYRLKAFNTYPHKCYICGWDEDERLLEVHHIDENHNNNDIDNLVILCVLCHRKVTLHYYKIDMLAKTLLPI